MKPNQKLIDAIEPRLKRIFTIEEFDQPSKCRIYLGDMPDMEKYLQAKEKVAEERSRGQFLACMLPCYKEPLLNRSQEQHQFRKYNLLKYMAQKRLAQNQFRYAHCLIERAIEIGNQIASANFRLAVSIVKKRSGVDEDKISDGYIDVMKAVDFFDWRKGFKFSTYTSWIISNTLIGNYHIQQRECERMSNFEETFENFECKDSFYEDEQKYEFDKKTVANLLEHCGPINAQLEDLKRRQYILSHRFGLGELEQRTLKEIGLSLGISKERVRQLEATSMEFIRNYLENQQKSPKKAA